MGIRRVLKMKYFTVVLLLIICLNCKDKKEDLTLDTSEKQEVVDELDAVVKVATEKAVKASFDTELLSNGKLTANKKADIPFELTERILSVRIANGDRVKKGQLLAVLDKTNTTMALKNAQIALDKAKIELQDILLGFGYPINDTLNIPPKILKNVKIQSNYSNAIAGLQEARLKYTKTQIKAPFSGIVANVNATANNLTSNYKNTLCTLIDQAKMRVDFFVLESEVFKVKKGRDIEVYQYTQSDTYKGKITAINPIVNQDGMVQITAVIENTKGELFDGMNVKVKIKNSLPNKIAVPKTAVLLRQDKHVVFVLKNNEAHWVYVDTGLENSTHIVIEKGIQPDDIVIVSGNTNLAHQTKVQVIN